MGVAYVKGLQADDLKHLKIAATLKHYAVNNVEMSHRTELIGIIAPKANPIAKGEEILRKGEWRKIFAAMSPEEGRGRLRGRRSRISTHQRSRRSRKSFR